MPQNNNILLLKLPDIFKRLGKLKGELEKLGCTVNITVGKEKVNAPTKQRPASKAGRKTDRIS